MDGIHGLAGEETWPSTQGRDTRRWLPQTWLMEAPVEMAGKVRGAGIGQCGQQVQRARTRRLHELVAGLTALLVIAAVFVFAKTPIFQDNIPNRTAAIKAVVISVGALASGSADHAVTFWDLVDPDPNPSPSPRPHCGPAGCW
jgi:hypothetical protein